MKDGKDRLPDGGSVSGKGEMLRVFLKGSLKYFILAIAFGLLRTVCTMVDPQILEYAVDSVLGEEAGTGLVAAVARFLFTRQQLRDSFYMIALVMIGIAVLSALFRHLFIFMNAKGGETFVRCMRDHTFRHIERLPMSWHVRHQTGDIIQRCTTDIEQVKTFLSDQLANLINCIITLAAAVAFMFLVSPKLALLVLLTDPILIAFTLFFHNKIGQKFRKCDELEGDLSTIAQENLTGVRVVRAFGRERYERDRFDRKSREVTDNWIHMGVLMSGFWEINALLSVAQGLIVLAVGTVMVVHGSLTVGALLAMISYQTTAAEPLRMLGRIVSEMSKAGVSVERLYEIMSAEEEQDPPEALEPDMHGDICFEHVSFAYPDGTEALHDVSFTIPAGSTVGILGSTGSGKSTLMQLLDRLYALPAGGGRITIGGMDIANMKADSLRRGIGLVLQEPMLFSRSLSENISIAADAPDPDTLRQAADTACLTEAIEGFAKGWDTEVGERGVTLSGGQKQRAAIARMLMQKAPVMIFDDSLSAVDAKTDAAIRSALKQEMAGATCILISHRISTLMTADNILVLDGGRIVEQGTHAQLAAGSGIYRSICDLQLMQAETGEGAEDHAE